MPAERFWWIDGMDGPVLYDEPSPPTPWSLKWLCTSCGDLYAYAKTIVDGKLQPFHFIHGTCPRCPGSRYSPPGSLETVRLINWQVPLEVALYQLQIELDFTTHHDHPRNPKETTFAS